MPESTPQSLTPESMTPEPMPESTREPMTRWVRTGELAAEVGVGPRTVTAWANAGKLPCNRTFGGHRRFNLTECLEILRANQAELHSKEEESS